MKKLLFFALLISITGFAQTSSEQGEVKHNCDEPCLKCGHKETCKNTKGDETQRETKEKKQTSSVNEEHSNHKHGSSQQ